MHALLLAATLLGQGAETVPPSTPFRIAVDYAQGETPAAHLRLYRDGAVVQTVAASTGTHEFPFPYGLMAGQYGFAVVAVTADGTPSDGNPTLTLTVAQEPEPDPDPTPASAVDYVLRTCDGVVTATAPDARDGWGVQFRRVYADGTTAAVGSRDTTVPYQRKTGLLTPGTYVFDGLWTRTDTPSVVAQAVTVVCD